MNCWNRCCCQAPCHTHKFVSLQLKWQHAEAHQGLNNSPAWREHTNGVKHTFQPSFPSPIIRNTQNPQPVDTTMAELSYVLLGNSSSSLGVYVATMTAN